MAYYYSFSFIINDFDLIRVLFCKSYDYKKLITLSSWQAKRKRLLHFPKFSAKMPFKDMFICQNVLKWMNGKKFAYFCAPKKKK